MFKLKRCCSVFLAISFLFLSIRLSANDDLFKDSPDNRAMCGFLKHRLIGHTQVELETVLASFADEGVVDINLAQIAQYLDVNHDEITFDNVFDEETSETIVYVSLGGMVLLGIGSYLNSLNMMGTWSMNFLRASTANQFRPARWRQVLWNAQRAMTGPKGAGLAVASLAVVAISAFVNAEVQEREEQALSNFVAQFLFTPCEELIKQPRIRDRIAGLHENFSEFVIASVNSI